METSMYAVAVVTKDQDGNKIAVVRGPIILAETRGQAILAHSLAVAAELKKVKDGETKEVWATNNLSYKGMD